MNEKHLKELGFVGFVELRSLIGPRGLERIPQVKGVYMVLRAKGGEPRFRITSPGGHFKERNPTVPVATLRDKWIDDAAVLYIGKAGSESGNATLRSRIRQYLRFGQGEPVGHWGGRYIWQLEDSGDLLFCWKPTPQSDPMELESALLGEFEKAYGRLPFANLRH